ncbi:MAG TPA: type VI secretion system-associated protein TagF [Bradyrhizobium sp.]|uniref:type VI secretion system-associated protein TagF n=1 Tax=Bradyrhizobium sp. TaxID=376 RepID=UPI002B4885A6|nr:type VI secretion system-associated protein TagF [Bradyrhizobium sp.]HKO72463.1 type VI secretion system-associated protein TagF [Bradyrhizobium sp.]
MRCGLFGKLSAKRDFIALATPRNFLETWEPWVQASLSASRHQLGDRWQQAFLTTPVWRFWLGAAICGSTVAGAIMPSLDGVGRYYPLTLHAVGDAGAPIAPPDIDAQDEWFNVGENFLLSTLDRAMAFEDISSALDRLPVPRTRISDEHDERIVSLGDGMAGMISAVDGFSASLSNLRAASPEVYAAASFWWTSGGGEFPPLVLSCRGLPDAYRYSTLLTGDLGEIAAVG